MAEPKLPRPGLAPGSLKLDLVAVVLGGCVVLGAAGSLMDPARIYVTALWHTMTDQVHHVGVARTLADTGRLETTLVHPAALGPEMTKKFVYMPGYHVLAAALYRLLGYSDLVAQLPAVLSYLAAAALLLVLGHRLAGPSTGRMAAFLFLVFPANVVYALSAMTDTCFVAAVLLAFLGFVIAPPRTRPLLVPPLLLVPFLVRETGALLVVPMAVLILAEAAPPGERIRRAATAVTLSVVLLGAVMGSPLLSGRPLLQRHAMFARDPAAYTSDALAYHALQMDWRRLPALFLERVAEPVQYLRQNHDLASDAMRASLAGIPLGVLLFLWRSEALGLAAAAYVVTTAAVHVFHFLWGPTGMRMLLTTMPFTALVVGRLCAIGTEALRAHGRARAAAALPAAGVVLAAFFAARELRATFSWYPHVAAYDDACTRFIVSIGHDDRRLIAAPPIALPYVHRHYPVKYSFLPDNAPTLSLLMERYDVGTIVLPVPHPLAGALPGAGFVLEAQQDFGPWRLAVWKSQGGTGSWPRGAR